MSLIFDVIADKVFFKLIICYLLKKCVVLQVQIGAHTKVCVPTFKVGGYIKHIAVGFDDVISRLLNNYR